MPYWVGFRLSSGAKSIFLDSFEDHEEAKRQYEYTRRTALPGELVTPPFFADTEDEARENIKIYFPD